MTAIPESTLDIGSADDASQLDSEPIGRAAVEDYLTLMSGFPTGVAVVTTLDPYGRPRGLTCSSLSSVTLDPPTLLVCLNIRSATLSALRCHGRFAVNLLHERGLETAKVFAASGVERFARVSWLPLRASGLPWLTHDAFAVAECAVSDILIVGDHAVVLGEVADILHTPDVPLLYGMRQFSSWLPASATIRG